MGASPERPGNDMGRLDTPLRKLRGNAVDFLHRPVNEGWFCFRIVANDVFWGVWRFA